MLAEQEQANLGAAIVTGTTTVVPFNTFLLKVASRCNINCSYCYVYNRGDNQWRRQPKLMSERAAKEISSRIVEHCKNHQKGSVTIIFHGGEPLMGGIKHVEMLLSTIKKAFEQTSINVKFGMQTNLLLFDHEMGDLLRNYKVRLGVSFDGPPSVNDQYRVDHQNKPTSQRFLNAWDLLQSEYYDLLSGLLSVIDVNSNPIEVYDYLVAMRPKSIDFLYPLDNHDRRPVGKDTFENVPYADWLIKIFDKWYGSNNKLKIRMFNNIIQTILGLPSRVESVGLSPVDIIVVETNGEIEAVDTLKTVYDGATQLGFNVEKNSFDDVLEDIRVKSRQVGKSALCDTCQQCNLVEFCGGGYVPHRYSQQNGYNNPSIYCHDLYKLISHIYKIVSVDVQKAKMNG